MASLKKRGNYYSIVFKKRVDGKPVRKTYALGVKYKNAARDKLRDYEKLYQTGKIDPFDPAWNLKEYEEAQKENGRPSFANSLYIQNLKEQFLEQKAHTSTHTQKAYESIIGLFNEHVGRSMTINLVEPRDIRQFCLQGRFSTATQRNYLRHLKAFFNWLVDNELLDENPCDEVNPPNKKDKIVDKVIREHQLKEVINKFREMQHEKRKANHLHDFTHMKFWFKPIITTAFYTGMRRKELLQLRWEHVDLEEREVHVTDTKTGSERSVVLFDPVYYRLSAWKKFLDDPDQGLVFPSPRSNAKFEIQLTGKTVSKAFKSVVRKSKIKNTVHFHGLRHSCATFMLRKGFDVLEVKDMLGHKSVEVTNRYVHLISKDRKKKAEKLGLITK